MFSITPGLTDIVSHDIECTTDVPVTSKSYRMSPRQANIVEREISKMVKDGVIAPGESDDTSPVTLVEMEGKEN